MRTFLAIAGSLIVAFSFLPYLLDTVHSKVKPRIATWTTWLLISVIATSAAIAAHAYASALLTGMSGLIEITVLIFALKNGDTTYEKIDFICQAIAVTGIIAWLITNNPTLAILFNIIADLFGSVPTVYHAWIRPYEEAWQSFVIFGVGSLVTVVSISEITFATVAFPIYFAINSLTIGFVIMLRQAQAKPKQ